MSPALVVAAKNTKNAVDPISDNELNWRSNVSFGVCVKVIRND